MTIDSSPRVLLVDDEPLVRRISIDILKSVGVTKILEAENGKDATAALKKNKVDLLITDIQMPEMNGIELIKQIRMGNTPADPELRIVVATSFADTEVLSSCLSLDINGFLVKPVTPSGATEKITRAMAERPKLHHAKTYQSVKSNLDILVEESQEAAQKPRASIPRESMERKKPGADSVSLKGLKPGMELLENLYARNGTKLLSKGELLNENLINRIRELDVIIDMRQLRVTSSAK